MNECRKEDLGWESTVRLALLREEDFGMYLEERDGRKRKWDGKMMRRDESEDREQRRVPPKKVMGEFSLFS
ncbi:PAP2-domain-containing protein [Operophtera brumata]|uniref:PAP2-domain-containing protein n=1 Tax=Operophtera brumata TaxID=104452 RepID=A0A0L7LJ91_OPEBR|nr:PAP2-domain-containing protein [Operophtera brumata]